MKKVIPILLLGSTLSYTANIEVTINNIKSFIGRLSIALDTEDTYDKNDKSNSIFSARKKVSALSHETILNGVES